MLRKNCVRLAGLFIGFLFSAVLLGAPQQELLSRSFPEVGQYIYRWDSVHKSLIFARDATPKDTAAPILAYHGSAAPTSISPLNDLPGAAEIDFWSISGAPYGAVSTSCTVLYGTDTKKVRHLILTYDQKGKLVKVWDVFPYLFQELAVDTRGNVYGFGRRVDKGDDDADGDYALLVAYSPEGKVLWESLPRSSFPWGSDMMSGGNHNENHLMISGDGLLLYVASTEELFRFDLTGKLLGRFALKTLLGQIAGIPGFKANVWSLVATGSGRVIAQVQLWPTNGQGSTKSSIVEFESDFANWRPLATSAGLNLARLLGTGDDGKLLFFARDAGGNAVLASTYIP